LSGVPPETTAMLDRARAALHDGRASEGKAICETILDQHPSHRGALLLLGIAYMQMNELAAALPRFEELTRIDPANANGWFQRGMCLIGLDRFDEAATSLRETTSLRPLHAMGQYYLGGSLACLGRYDQALPSLEQARILAPSDPAIETQYATTSKWTRGPEEALQAFKALTEGFPDYAPGWVGKAILHLLVADYPEGWKLHEWRLKLPTRSIWDAIARIPRWDGQPVPPGSQRCGPGRRDPVLPARATGRRRRSRRFGPRTTKPCSSPTQPERYRSGAGRRCFVAAV
jgi:tetratricopeptide (TPR) repeat protein